MQQYLFNLIEVYFNFPYSWPFFGHILTHLLCEVYFPWQNKYWLTVKKNPQQSLQFAFFISSFVQTYIKTAEEALIFPVMMPAGKTEKISQHYHIISVT